MRSFILYLFLFVLLSSLKAGQNKADSLIIEVNNTTDLEIKARLYNEIGNTYRYFQTDSALKYLYLAEQISKANNLHKQLAESYIERAIVWEKKRNHDSTQILLKLGYTVSKKHSYHLGILKSLNSIGLYKHLNKKYEQAYVAFDEALLHIDNIQDKKVLTMLFNNIAMNHRATNKTDLALESYHKALLLSEELDDERGIGIICSNMGLLYQAKGKTELALEYLNRSLEIRQKRNNPHGLYIVLLNLGLVFENENEYQIALQYYKKALPLAKKLNHENNVAKLNNNIAIVFKEMEMYDSAFYYCRISLKQRQKQNNQSGIAHTKTTLAQLYLLNNKYNEALETFTEALDIANKDNDLRLLQKINKGLYNTYYDQGHYKQAFNFLIKYQAVSDSLFNIESQKNLDNVEGKYQNLKKEKENQFLQKENQLKDEKIKRQLYFGIAIISVFVLILIILAIVIHSKKRIRKVNLLLRQKNQEIELQAQNLEVALDRQKELMQLNESIISMIAHDLKNPLNAIINISALDKMKEKEEFIQHAGRNMLNMVLNLLDVYKPGTEKIKLDKKKILLSDLLNKVLVEVDFLIKERSLKIRIPSDTACTINTDENILYRIITNLLTNAIKFAPNNSVIDIKLKSVDENSIKISVSNQGPGIKESDQQSIFNKFVQAERRKSGNVQSSGLGLAFCKLATEALGGEIGVISESPTGVEFWFTHPEAICQLKKLNPPVKDVTTKLTLKDDEVRYLAYYKQQLKGRHIFEVTAINKVINQIDKMSPSIDTWKKCIDEAVFSGNQERFNSLIN